MWAVYLCGATDCFLHALFRDHEAAPDVTLSDYIARKQEGEKKLTFDEWFAKNEDEVNDEYTNGENIFKFIWNAALTKGKL